MIEESNVQPEHRLLDQLGLKFVVHRFPLSGQMGCEAGWPDKISVASTHELVGLILANDLDKISQPDLRRFARRLLRLPPLFWLEWTQKSGAAGHCLVLSSDPMGLVIGNLAAGISSPNTIYLSKYPEPPPDVAVTMDLVTAFFWWFGGLRTNPPGFSGEFYDWPTPVTRTSENDSDEDEFQYTPWEDAREVFENDQGDALIVAKDGMIGWRLHDDLSHITTFCDSFRDVLQLFLEGRLSPYDSRIHKNEDP